MRLLRLSLPFACLALQPVWAAQWTQCAAALVGVLEAYETPFTEAEQSLLDGLDNPRTGPVVPVHSIAVQLGAHKGLPAHLAANAQASADYLLGKLIIWNQRPVKNNPKQGIPAAGKILAIKVNTEEYPLRFFATIQRAAITRDDRPYVEKRFLNAGEDFYYRESPDTEHAAATLSDSEQQALAPLPWGRHSNPGESAGDSLIEAARKFEQQTSQWVVGNSSEKLPGTLVALRSEAVETTVLPAWSEQPFSLTRVLRIQVGKALAVETFSLNGMELANLTLLTPSGRLDYVRNVDPARIRWRLPQEGP